MWRARSSAAGLRCWRAVRDGFIACTKGRIPALRVGDARGRMDRPRRASRRLGRASSCSDSQVDWSRGWARPCHGSALGRLLPGLKPCQIKVVIGQAVRRIWDGISKT